MENLPVTYDDCTFLLRLFEKAAEHGFPGDKGEQVRAHVMQDMIRKRMANLEKDRWQGNR